MKLEGQTSIPWNNRVLAGQKDETAQKAYVLPVPMDGKPAEVAEMVQHSRFRKGNRAVSNDLELKADELERLFAEHKVRSASALRRRPVRLPSAAKTGGVKPVAPAEHVCCLPNSVISREGLVESVESDARGPVKMANKEDDDGSSSLPDDTGSSKSSRGRYYEKYMQIRDAKLGEEWRSNGAAKEAQLKAMHEQLDHCLVFMKSRLSLSSNRQDGDPHRARKLKTRAASATAPSKQQTFEGLERAVGDSTQDFSEEMEFDQDRFVGGMLSDSYKSQCPIDFISSRNATSSVSKTSAASISRSITKPANPSQERVRTHSETLLSQSVPNTSELRKENGGIMSKTKPVTKLSYSHKKSKSAKINLVQDDCAGRSQSIGKSCDAVGGLNDAPSTSTDDSMAMPLLQDKPVSRSVQKRVESKPFLRKGKGIGPGAGAVIAKMKASVALENLSNKEEPEGLHAETENSRQINHEGNEFKMGSAEEASMTDDENYRLSASRQINHDRDESQMGSAEEASKADCENHRISTGSGGNLDPGNSDVLELNPQMQVTSLPAVITSNGSNSSTEMLESPLESPTSWSSNVQHAFAHARHISNIDAFVDSPVSSSASGNFHHSDQTIDSDSAWMRSESGNTHKPILAGSTPHKTKINVTKGFKRLLKFAKKSNRDDILVNDRVSSSTNSGGDENIEDSCDQGSLMSDHVKKSRMGLLQYHSAHDETNIGDISDNQGESIKSSSPVHPDGLKLIRERHPSGSYPKTPRSFFSLSTFRSKGSKPKLRLT